MGFLEVGTNDKSEVVVNFDRDQVGHVVFSAPEARSFANLLLKKSVEVTHSKDQYMPIPVNDANAIAERYAKNQVVILAWDQRHCLTHATTFGLTAFDKENAAAVGKICTAAIGGDLGKQQKFEDFHDHYEPAMLRESLEILKTILRRQGQATPPQLQQIERLLKASGHGVRQS